MFGFVFNHRCVPSNPKDGVVERMRRLKDGVMGDVGHYGSEGFHQSFQ